MSSEPIAPGKQAGLASKIWVRLIRLTSLLLVLACACILYPHASFLICLHRIRGAYEPLVDRASGAITGFSVGSRADRDRLRAWEEELNSRPTARLLSALRSDDPLDMLIVSKAIATQQTVGRLVGWPGRRETVARLDPEAAETVLELLDRELPAQVVESLVLLLTFVSTDSPHYDEVLLDCLEHRQPLVRSFGMRVLESKGVDSEEMQGIVSRLAKDPDAGVRSHIVSGLHSHLRHKSDEFPAAMRSILLGAFADEDPTVRSAAVGSLDLLGWESEDARELLPKLLSDSDANIRYTVLRAVLAACGSGRLTRLPESIVRPLTQAMAGLTGDQHRDMSLSQLFLKLLTMPTLPVEKRWELIEAELKSPYREFSGESYAADLRDALFLPSERERYRWHGSVDWKLVRAQFRPLALEARPRLVAWASQATGSEDENTAAAAAGLLAVLAPNEPERIAPLLSHPSELVKTTALASLRPTDAQLPRLLELIQDANPRVRNYAIAALERYDRPFTSDQVDVVVQVFRKEEAWSRSVLFRVLKRLSPPGLDPDQLLVEALQSDSNEAIRWAEMELDKGGKEMARFLPYVLQGIRTGRLGAPAVLMVLEVGQPIESPEDVSVMIELLMVSGPRGEPASEKWPQQLEALMKLSPPESADAALLDGLVRSLATQDERTQRIVAKLISESRREISEVLDRLGKLLGSDQPEARAGAALALETLGPRARSVVAALIGRLADPEVNVRISAARAIGAVGSEAGPDAADALAKMAAKDPVPGCQAYAVDALAKMGEHLRPHVGTLEELSKRGDFMVRQAAQRALDSR